MSDRSLVAVCDAHEGAVYVAGEDALYPGAPSYRRISTRRRSWFWDRPSIYDLWADLRDLDRRIRPDFDRLVAEGRDACLAAPR